MNTLKQENSIEINYNNIFNEYIIILQEKFSCIDWLFIYGSFARWDFKKWSDIDIFLVLDLDYDYHNFIVDNIEWVQITTEVVDQKNFYNDIFDNRLAQAKVIIDNNSKLTQKQLELKNNFFNEKNVKKRVFNRTQILKNILWNYNNLSEIEKVLAIFTFIKIYSLVVMDLKLKIPSKKIEYNEVLDFLDKENAIKWIELINLWFDYENIGNNYKKISRIIYKISEKIKKNLALKIDTPFTSRINNNYYNDFLESTLNNDTLVPLITWIEIIVSKYCIFHTSNSSLSFSDFTLDFDSINILKENIFIKKEFLKIEALVKNTDKTIFDKLYFNMLALLDKI